MIIEKTLKEIRKNVETINARNDADDHPKIVVSRDLTPDYIREAKKDRSHRAGRFIGKLPAVDTSKDGCENLPTGLEEK